MNACKEGLLILLILSITLVGCSKESSTAYSQLESTAVAEPKHQEEKTFDTAPVTIDGYIYWGGNGPDGSANRVITTMALKNVVHGVDAYNLLLQNDPNLQKPGPDQEYVVITLDVKYEDGDLDELDMMENIARQPGYNLHFTLSNENSNAIDVTYSLDDPIYNIRLAKGDSAAGSVAFLQEIGNTQPLVFDGFDEITVFEIQNAKAQ